MIFRNTYFKVGLIIGIFLLAVLIVLPRIPIQIHNNMLDVEGDVGGYYVSLFGGKKIIDLRSFKKGLDLSGGVRVVLRADMSKISDSDREKAFESAREIIERRVNFLGVSEPYIVPVRTGDEYRIVVEIPGLENVSSAIELIGQTAQLNFKQLKADFPWDGTQFQQYYLDPTVWEPTGVTGADLRGVDVVFSKSGELDATASPQIQLHFTLDGRKKFEEVAKNNISKPIALFLDEDSAPLSMPQVSPDLANGLIDDPVISGNFDTDTANALSVQIRAGALPVPVEILEQETIGATLGAEAISKSVRAGIIGIVIILVFMIVVYGRLGLVADFALILYALIVLAIFKIIPVVLTLPGIAGFLLSAGIAVDANILIFERVREELKWGRPRSLAIKFGFERAWNSIRDSNASALITAAILFYLGTGQVRGFALTLAIGILVSLFTAVFATRTLIYFMGLAKEKNNTVSSRIKSKLSGKLARIKHGNS